MNPKFGENPSIFTQVIVQKQQDGRTTNGCDTIKIDRKFGFYFRYAYFCLSIRIVFLFVLRFYGPVNPMGSCWARSVYLTTHLLGKLSPLSVIKNCAHSFTRNWQLPFLNQQERMTTENISWSNELRKYAKCVLVNRSAVLILSSSPHDFTQEIFDQRPVH